MRVSTPIPVALPDYGVLFAESAHATDFRMEERTDPYHKLIYVLAGSVTYQEKRHTLPLGAGAGSILIVPQGMPHRIADQEPSILLLLCIGAEFLGKDPDLARLWLALARVPQHLLRLSRPARQQVESMWRRALVEKQHPRIGGLVAVRVLAAQTLVLLARLPSDGAGTTATERVAAIKREIDDTFYDQWDLDRAATRAGLSRRRFTELFRAAAGQTFWDFLNEKRLTHAAELLRTGENSVLGVMFAAGFNDLSHFYRQFRQRYGKPPSQWRSENSRARP